MSIATLLSQHHKVTAVDIIPEKVELINNKKSPIQDEYIEKYLAEKELDLTATLDAKEAYSDADFVVIAAPTNYDSKKNFFDTSAVEAVIKLVIEYNPEAMDVFVFPSLFEGLGIVAIEAQAAGVPIVCSEGLPPETDITPIYRKLLLSDGEEKWANTALEMAQNLKAHTNMQQYVIDAGFDMDATAKYMESYYLNRWRTA